jgi:hypothetical protein
MVRVEDEGSTFARNVGIRLPTEAAPYPQWNPQAPFCDHHKTCNPKVHTCVHNGLQLVLSQINPIDINQSCSYKMPFKIVLPIASWHSEASVSLGLPHQNSVCISLLHHTSYVCCLFYPLLFCYPDGVRRQVQASNLLFRNGINTLV